MPGDHVIDLSMLSDGEDSVSIIAPPQKKDVPLVITGGASSSQAARSRTKKQIKLPDDVPWGRLVALKDCKAVTRGRQYDLLSNIGGFTQIGRNSHSHVQFLDLTVSGVHVVLTPKIKDGILVEVMIEDRSSNGTWHNSKRMPKKVPRKLKSGDIISLVQPFRRGTENVAAFVFSAIRNAGAESCLFFKDYKLGSELGRGTYATVRRCTHRTSKQEFAVKIIVYSGMAQGWEVEELIKNAKNEAAMQRELDHPNVIKVYDHFVDRRAGTVYIVMELLLGGELFVQLRRAGKYNEAEGREIMKQNPKTRPFLNMLTTSTLGTVLPTFKEEYGEDKNIDIMFSPSHSLFLAGFPNTKMTGIYIDKNGNWKVQINIVMNLNVETSPRNWESARDIYMTAVFKMKTVVDDSNPLSKKFSWTPKNVEITNLKVLKGEEEMTMEQMMI